MKNLAFIVAYFLDHLVDKVMHFVHVCITCNAYSASRCKSVRLRTRDKHIGPIVYNYVQLNMHIQWPKK